MSFAIRFGRNDESRLPKYTLLATGPGANFDEESNATYTHYR